MPADFAKDNVDRFAFGEITVRDWRGTRDTPCLIAFDSDDNIVHALHWFNTTLRYFWEGEDDEYDHIETRLDNGDLVAFVGDVAVHAALEAMSFPSRYDPEVDEPTLKWKAELEAIPGQIALEEYLSGHPNGGERGYLG